MQPPENRYLRAASMSLTYTLSYSWTLYFWLDGDTYDPYWGPSINDWDHLVGLLATMSPEVFVSFQHRQCAKTYSKILPIYTVWLLACERVCLCMFLCVCVCFCVPMFVFVLPVRREILTWKGISEMIKFDFPTEEFQSDCFWLNFYLNGKKSISSILN